MLSAKTVILPIRLRAPDQQAPSRPVPSGSLRIILGTLWRLRKMRARARGTTKRKGPCRFFLFFVFCLPQTNLGTNYRPRRKAFLSGAARCATSFVFPHNNRGPRLFVAAKKSIRALEGFMKNDALSCWPREDRLDDDPLRTRSMRTGTLGRASEAAHSFPTAREVWWRPGRERSRNTPTAPHILRSPPP